MLSAITSAAESFAGALAAKVQKIFMYAGLIIPVFLFVAIVFTLTNKETGCVESYQFDSENSFINAKPTGDGIFGGPYNDSSGGENAAWHPTGLRTDGGKLIFEIRGAWTAWDDANSQDELERLPACNICAKKSGVDNCICKIGEISKPEINSLGQTLTGVDCSVGGNDQENPASCTCTNAHGTINDFGTYFISTDYQDKSEALKLPDDQNTCRYTAGLGLYVGLFGKNGNTMPIRAYQVYPTTEVCDITRNAQGKCVDSSGNDQTKYVYESPNGKTFIKDDKSGNNGTDTNPADDEYHQSGEFIKFIINDRYYQDNFGGYDINFMGGFIRQNDSGLLEYIVSNFEDIILGKIKYDDESTINVREGGVLEFLYNAIVKDSAFILIVQMCLIMYIVLFGIWVLSGNLQISNKEMSKRIIKIALVIFFTTESSWYFYNQLVVGLFKDGMDAVIAIFMNGSDKALDQTSLIYTSQLDRATSVSYSTRFSYVDAVIKKLLSTATSRKIWSLFFGEWFGMLYIPVIYALIGAFVYIMLTAAFVYICALLRLIFVLCLGPIFMVTVLFNRTDDMFKKWLSFMGSQTIQMICLFLVLYLFVVLIDVGFNDLLSYRACTDTINFGLFNINFLKSETNRGLVEWIMMFAKIATLLFLLKMIMEKIPGFAGHLVSINSQPADTSPTFVGNTNNSAFGLAKGIMGKAFGAASSAVTKGLPSAMSMGLTAARFTGLSNVGNSIREKIPFRSPASLYRDNKIDSIIKSQQAAGKAAGKKGTELDKFVRAKTFEEINKLTSTAGKDAAGKAAAKSTANTFNIFGVDNHDAINKRLHQKLVAEPLKKAIKDVTAELKKDCREKGIEMPLTKAALDTEIRKRIGVWADKNSSTDKATFSALLDQDQYSSLVKKYGSLTSDEAAKMFAGNEKEKNRYLQHLQHRQFEKEKKKTSGTRFQKFKNSVKDGARGLQRSAAYNPKMARENFLRKAQWEEAVKDNQENYGLLKQGLNYVGINPEKTSIIQRVNVLDKLGRREEMSEMAKQAQKDAMVGYLKDVYPEEKAAIEQKFKDDTKLLDDKAKADPTIDLASEYKALELSKNSQLESIKEKGDNFIQTLGKEHSDLKNKADSAQSILDETLDKLYRTTDQDEMDSLNEKVDSLELKAEETKVAFKASQDVLNELVESDHNRKVASDSVEAKAASAKAAEEEKTIADAKAAEEAAAIAKAEAAKTPEQKAADALVEETKKAAEAKAVEDKAAAEAAKTPEQKAAEASAANEATLISKQSAITNKLQDLKIKKGEIQSKIVALKLKKSTGKLSEAEEKALEQLENQETKLDSDIDSSSKDLEATIAKLEPK